MLMTTEQSPTLPIKSRLGLVSGQCVIGLNILRDVTALFKDLTGQRLGTAEGKYAQAREAVVEQLKLQADALGADAIIAIQFDHGELTGGSKAMLTCSAVERQSSSVNRREHAFKPRLLHAPACRRQ